MRGRQGLGVGCCAQAQYCAEPPFPLAAGVRHGRADGNETAGLRAGSAADAIAAASAPERPEATSRNGLIEIELACGHRVRIDGSVDAAALRRVIAVLEG